MSQNSFKTSIQVANLQEQLSILHKELADVSREYVDKTNSIAKLDAREKAIKESEILFERHVEETRKQLDLRTEEVNRQHNAIAVREQEHVETIKKSHEDLNVRHATVTEKEKQLSTASDAISIDLKQKTERLSKLMNQNVLLLKTIELNKETIKEQDDQKRANVQAISEQHRILEIELEEHNKLILQKQNELKELSNKADAEAERFLQPAKTLHAEEQKIERKRRDLQIYELRIRSQWAVLHPDQQVII